jgi:hypothetical protein
LGNLWQNGAPPGPADGSGLPKRQLRAGLKSLTVSQIAFIIRTLDASTSSLGTRTN